jgi:hypothetical protein
LVQQPRLGNRLNIKGVVARLESVAAQVYRIVAGRHIRQRHQVLAIAVSADSVVEGAMATWAKALETKNKAQKISALRDFTASPSQNLRKVSLKEKLPVR